MYNEAIKQNKEYKNKKRFDFVQVEFKISEEYSCICPKDSYK